ncbi:NAD(P)-binding protein [Lentinula aciculospora]|uniref:NAD(P)-binding protein n=1 Tax=Lentinula aciculospora TaxID=153920 RepID=A0A9W9A012_9AGAR|nr:NAD(P)-binding protein [Lentinula aciculospora]
MSFSESDIPDLHGKVMIVTGGNSGIGKQTVAVLALHGARVYLAARTKEKYEQALNEIHTSYPATADAQTIFLQLDLSTATGAKSAAEDFKLKESVLHVLYNNAGVMGTPKGKLSSDGYEYQWAVNVLGPFVFTYHLLPILERTAENSPFGTVRIINTASDGAKQAPKFGIPLDDPTVGSNATRFECYGHSKLGNILITRQLAQRHPNILSLAPHPGPVQSGLTRELGIPRPIMWILNHVVFKSVKYGALTQLYAGTAPAIDSSKNGSFLVPLAKFEKKLPHAQCYDEEFGKKVWDWNMEAMRKAGSD